jgi:hypothetical protein
LIKQSDTGTTEVILGGNTNRNPAGLEDKFNRIVNRLREKAGLS